MPANEDLVRSHDAVEEPLAVDFDGDSRIVTIAWADGRISRFPFIWLRHDCFFPCMGRPDQPADVPFLIAEDPKAVTVAAIERVGSTTIEIAWSHDGSRTRHDLRALRLGCVSEAARAERRPRAETWDSAAAARFPWFQGSDLENPRRRLRVFEHLLVQGIVFLRDCPVAPGSLVDMARHFGAIRRSHFGELFDIRSTPQDRMGSGDKIGATASNDQAPHVDDGFRHGVIGINFFHALKPHDRGEGKSIFVDGFRVAEALRDADPEAFEFLSTVPLQFAAERNPEERFRTKRRMIATDSDGIVRGISVTDRTFPPMNLPEAQIEPAYAALRAFSRELSKAEFSYEILLQAGDLAIFDNHRVLHARTAFDAETGSRHIQQVSVDREEFHSSLRRLAEAQGRDDLANLDSDAGALSQR